MSSRRADGPARAPSRRTGNAGSPARRATRYSGRFTPVLDEAESRPAALPHLSPPHLPRKCRHRGRRLPAVVKGISPLTSEQWIGQRVFLGIGVAALLAAAGYLLKLSFDRNWITPVMRCLGGVGAGVVVGAIGWRLHSRYRTYGAALIGAGAGIIYLSVWAAAKLYGVVPSAPGIVGLALVSVALAMIAYAINVEALGTAAALGAFMAPVLSGKAGPTPISCSSIWPAWRWASVSSPRGGTGGSPCSSSPRAISAWGSPAPRSGRSPGPCSSTVWAAGRRDCSSVARAVVGNTAPHVFRRVVAAGCRQRSDRDALGHPGRGDHSRGARLVARLRAPPRAPDPHASPRAASNHRRRGVPGVVGGRSLLFLRHAVSSRVGVARRGAGPVRRHAGPRGARRRDSLPPRRLSPATAPVRGGGRGGRRHRGHTALGGPAAGLRPARPRARVGYA